MPVGLGVVRLGGDACRSCCELGCGDPLGCCGCRGGGCRP